MQKVLITAHTSDEHGQHYPGDVIDLAEGEAQAYVDKQWGIIQPHESKEKAAAIETPEDALPEHETADVKRKKK